MEVGMSRYRYSPKVRYRYRYSIWGSRYRRLRYRYRYVFDIDISEKSRYFDIDISEKYRYFDIDISEKYRYFGYRCIGKMSIFRYRCIGKMSIFRYRYIWKMSISISIFYSMSTFRIISLRFHVFGTKIITLETVFFTTQTKRASTQECFRTREQLITRYSRKRNTNYMSSGNITTYWKVHLFKLPLQKRIFSALSPFSHFLCLVYIKPAQLNNCSLSIDDGGADKNFWANLDKTGKALWCFRHHSKGDDEVVIGGHFKYISSSIKAELLSGFDWDIGKEGMREKLSINDNSVVELLSLSCCSLSSRSQAVTPENVCCIKKLIWEHQNITHREIQEPLDTGSAAVDTIWHKHLGIHKGLSTNYVTQFFAFFTPPPPPVTCT